MVTTRSAEKQAAGNGKLEELTLRSKPEQSSPSVRVPRSETSTPSSTRKKAKVLVNVPPPRKRARLSYDGSVDAEDTEANSTAVVSSVDVQQDRTVNDEVPDSQETITELDISQPAKPQPVTAASEDVSTPQTQASTKRKRKSTGIQPIRISATTVTGAGAHKRFGSEDSIAEGDAVEVHDKDEEQVLHSIPSDDKDDAPEVATTKATPVSGSSRRKRPTRMTRPARKPVKVEGAEGVDNTDQDTSSQPLEVGEGRSKATTIPALKVDIERDPNTTIAIGSDDSQDSAFVTARTTRHHDVFSTPVGGTPQLPSPTRDRLSIEDKALVPLRQPAAAMTSLSEDLATVKLSKPKALKTTPSSTNTASLPSKPGNSLEHYRRQMLQNRADKASGSTRGRTFKLQEEWTGKRRNFVIGY